MKELLAEIKTHAQTISERTKRLNSGNASHMKGVLDASSSMIISKIENFTNLHHDCSSIFFDIIQERIRQDKKWGEQNHKPIEWCAILGEEVGEVNKAALEAHFKMYYKDTNQLKEYKDELIQVAATAVAMLQSLERNKPLYQRKEKHDLLQT